MKSLFNLGKRFVADEKAAEVTELGIVLALIVVLSIAFIKGIGLAVSAAYTAPTPASSDLHMLARLIPGLPAGKFKRPRRMRQRGCLGFQLGRSVRQGWRTIGPGRYCLGV